MSYARPVLLAGLLIALSVATENVCGESLQGETSKGPPSIEELLSRVPDGATWQDLAPDLRSELERRASSFLVQDRRPVIDPVAPVPRVPAAEDLHAAPTLNDAKLSADVIPNCLVEFRLNSVNIPAPPVTQPATCRALPPGKITTFPLMPSVFGTCT